MYDGPAKRTFTSGPGGPAGATTAAALTDVVTAIKAVLQAADVPAARTALGLGNVSNLAPADLPVSTAQASAIATAIAGIVNSSPAALDTLKELADALGDDPNFATTVATLIGLKVNALAPAGTVKANLSGSTANVTDATFTQLLDAIYGAGAARGAILVRSASAWGGLALGSNGQTLQSNGTDLVFAASAPGTGAVRYDTAQSIGTPAQRQALTNVGAASGVRQTVQSGPAASGAPSFLPTSTSGTLVLSTQGLGTGAPLITSIAAGFDAAGPFDIVSAITSNLSQTLAASSTLALYIDVGTTSTPTPSFGAGTLFPIYQFGGTISTVSGQYTFDYQAMQGWLGNGSTAVKCNRVYVGEAVTSASAVTSTIAYAFNGYYDSGWTATLPAGSTSTTKSHNLGVQPGRKVVIAENTTTDQGYAVGDQIGTDSGLGGWNGTYWAGVPFTSTRTSIQFVTGNNTAWWVMGKSNNAFGGLTAASWRWRLMAQRAF